MENLTVLLHERAKFRGTEKAAVDVRTCRKGWKKCSKFLDPSLAFLLFQAQRNFGVIRVFRLPLLSIQHKQLWTTKLFI